MLRVASAHNQLVALFVPKDNPSAYNHVLFAAAEEDDSVSNVTSSFVRESPHEELLDFVVVDPESGHGVALVRTAPGTVEAVRTAASSNSNGKERVRVCEDQERGHWKLQCCNTTGQVVEICRHVQSQTVTWWRFEAGNGELRLTRESRVQADWRYLGLCNQQDSIWAVFQTPKPGWIWLSAQEGTRNGRWKGDGGLPVDVQRVKFAENGALALFSLPQGRFQIWECRDERSQPKQLRDFASASPSFEYTSIIWQGEGYEGIGTDEGNTMLGVSKFKTTRTLVQTQGFAVADHLYHDFFKLGQAKFVVLCSDLVIRVFDDAGRKQFEVRTTEGFRIPPDPPGLRSVKSALLKRIRQGDEEITRKSQALADVSRVVERLEEFSAGLSFTPSSDFVWPQEVPLVNLRTGKAIASNEGAGMPALPLTLGTCKGAWFHGPTSYIAVAVTLDHERCPKDLQLLLSSKDGSTSNGNFRSINRTEILVWALLIPSNSSVRALTVDVLAISASKSQALLVCSVEVKLSLLLVNGWVRVTDGTIEMPPAVLYRSRSLSLLALPVNSEEVTRLDVFAADEIRLKATVEELRNTHDWIAKDWSKLFPLARSLLNALGREGEQGNRDLVDSYVADDLAALLMSSLNDDLVEN